MSNVLQDTGGNTLKVHGGGVFGSAAAAVTAWQLASTNYVDRSVDPVLIHPRPDAETPVWAKHRRQHPNAPYRIPIGISFGSWPFYFESVTMPTGATIGGFLTTSGDKLIVGDDYGVVHWATPEVGTHSFHIKVHFQDGYAPINVQWTLEVTTTGTIFIDPTASDNTGAGTFADPFKTVEGWYKSDETDTTFTEYQVCYRGGTHDAAVDNTINSNTTANWFLRGTDKPLVHYGYYGETVVMNMSATQINHGNGTSVLGGADGSDCFYGGIEFNGLITGVNNPRHFAFYGGTFGLLAYSAASGGNRNTWFETGHKDVINYTTSADNAGVCWCPNPGAGNKRHYWYQSGLTFENCYMDATATATSNTNYNGFYLSSVVNWLAENSTAINTKFGKGVFDAKTGSRYQCQRNIDFTLSPDQLIAVTVGGSYDVNDGGPNEISYSRGVRTNTTSGGYVLKLNANTSTYDAGNANHFPIYLTRNTLSRLPVTTKSIVDWSGKAWPYVDSKNIYVGDDIVSGATDPAPDGTNFITYNIASNPLDASLNLLDATAKSTHLGKYGAEVST